MSFKLGLMALVAAVSLGTVASVQAATINPVVEYTTSGVLFDSRPFTLGYDFSLSSALNVTALGYWDNGRNSNHQVGIWNSSNVLVASTTVLGTDTLQGHFRWGSIGPVTLAAGRYTIGGEFLGDGSFNSFATGIVTNPAYTYGQDRFSAPVTGLNLPTSSSGGAFYGANGILEVSFATGGVPEPASWALMISGFGVAGAMIRRRRAVAA